LEVTIGVRNEVERGVLGRGKQDDEALNGKIGMCLGHAKVALVLRVVERWHVRRIPNGCSLSTRGTLTRRPP
jgi:hypothetical protein